MFHSQYTKPGGKIFFSFRIKIDVFVRYDVLIIYDFILFPFKKCLDLWLTFFFHKNEVSTRLATLQSSNGGLKSSSLIQFH